MPLILGILWLIFSAEIIGLTWVLSALIPQSRPNGLRPLGIAIVATTLAWAIPTEYWLGATLVQGPFQPWGVASTVAFLLVVALPAAFLFGRTK